MSTWTQNDLQNQAPADVAMTELPLVMRSIIEDTARRVSLSGLEIDENDLMPFGELDFLSSSHPFHVYYQQKLIDIGAGKEGAPIDLYAEPLFSYPAEIPLRELGIMMLTAQFLVRYGASLEDKLVEMLGSNPLFEFMKPYHKWMGLWHGLLSAYSRVLTRSKRKSDTSVLDCFLDRLQLDKLQKGDETALVDLHAFVTGLDSFAHMVDRGYSEITCPPPDLSAMMKQMLQLTESRKSQNQNQDGAQPDPPATHEFVGVLEPRKSSLTLPAGITLQELDLIKLTAQFVALFKRDFLEDLIERVAMIPHFEFMKPTSSRIVFFNGLVALYSRVLSHPVFESDAQAHACTASALECFFKRLQMEKLEEEAMIDVHTFVSGLDCFALMEDDDYSAIMPQPAHLSTMINLPTQIQGSQSQAPSLPPST